MRLHHVAVGTRDVERLAAFYARVFSLPELRRHRYSTGRLRSVWLDLDGAILMIEHSTEPARHVEGVGSGPFLLAFSTSMEHRAELEEELARAGANIEASTEHSAYARDPDGNRIAISHYREPARPIDGAS